MKRWVLALTLLTAACREPVIRDIDGFFRPTPDACPTCTVPAGDHHLCGTTEWCEECGVDMVPDSHICGENHYCAECRRTHVNGIVHEE